MSALAVLKIEDGVYSIVSTIHPPPKQKRMIALRKWIEKNGEDGETYRLANWLTPAVTAKKTMSFELAPAVESKSKVVKAK